MSAMFCLNDVKSVKLNHLTRHFFIFIIVCLIPGDWHRTFSPIQTQANGGFGDMSFILHAGLYLNFRCSPVSVCVGKSLQPPPVFTSSSVQRTSTDKIQVRVYIWVTCCPTVVFLQAGNRCVLWDRMSLWLENSSIHTFSGIIQL